MIKYTYLLGNPVRHTLGPVVMQAGCNSLGIEARSEEWQLDDPAGLPEAVRRIRAEEVLGVVVTIPYKVAIIPFLDDLDAEASQMGAVNTIYKRGGRLMGCNTDVIGFMTSLTREGSFEPQGKRATILGAGGAARACGFALAKGGIRSLAFVDPTHEGFADLIDTLKALGIETATFTYEASGLREAIAASDLLINCTPVGVKNSPLEDRSPIGQALIGKGQMVYDVIYKPLETPFLRMAKEAGAQTLNGLTWAVYTCAESVRLFTGRAPSPEAMHQAALDMGQREGW